MRWIMVAVLGCVVACSDNAPTSACRYQDHDYAVGDTWPAGDNCNDCTCTTTGFVCTTRPCPAPVDANPATLCQPMGTCTSGPPCGSSCCQRGERCELGVCHCGTGSACGAGDTCEAAGPVGGDQCGAVCCGASGPCPQ